MERSSPGSAGRKSGRYRITVKGEVSQMFVEPLGNVHVAATAGDSTTLVCEDVDQAKLQAVLAWFYERGVEIVSVTSDDGDEAVDPPSS